MPQTAAQIRNAEKMHAESLAQQLKEIREELARRDRFNQEQVRRERLRLEQERLWLEQVHHQPDNQEQTRMEQAQLERIQQEHDRMKQARLERLQIDGDADFARQLSAELNVPSLKELGFGVNL
jgi:hypothetical protein